MGELARSRGAEAPERVISSAKSWLSYGGIDRRAGGLPLNAPSDIERISPVEASFRLLDHLNEAFRAARPQCWRGLRVPRSSPNEVGRNAH